MNLETAEDSLKELEKYRSQLADQVGKLQAPLEHPAAQKALKWASHPDFLDAIQEIATHPSLKTMALCELVFAVSFWIVRIWLSSQKQTFGRRITTQLLGFVFYWAVTLFLLPFLFLGSSAEKLFHVLWEIAKSYL